MSLRFLGLLAAAALIGCGPSGPPNAVNLTVVADATLTPERRAQVTDLTIDVSGVHATSKSYAIVGLPNEERVQLVPAVSSGSLSIRVTAHDDRGNLLASGMTDAELTGGLVARTVTLTYVAKPTITVTPATATVTRTRTLQLAADRPVTWSTSAGTIDANGLFTAPDQPGGPITVTATSTTDATNTGTATITVADYGLELLAGKPGGWGEADGVGGEARFLRPNAVVSDGAGTLYIGDDAGCTIRKVDIATQTVTTIGGQPRCENVDGRLGVEARFAGIRAMALDTQRNTLWVGSQGVLRKVDLTTGTVTTPTQGDGSTPSFRRVGGLALDSANQLLYVASANGHVIYRVSTASATLTPDIIAGTSGIPGSADAPSGPATNASFNRPLGLAFDGSRLFIADSVNHTIRQLTLATGAVTTVAGMAGTPAVIDGIGGAARLWTPTALALSVDKQTLFIGEADGGTVRAMPIGNQSVTRVAGVAHTALAPGAAVTFIPPSDGSPGTQARFGSVSAISVDASGLFVTDGDAGTLRQMTNGTFDVSTVAGTAPSYGHVDGAGAVARFWLPASVSGDGRRFYVVENENATVRGYDLATGQVSTIAGSAGLLGGDDGVGANARFSRPEGLFLDGGYLYVGDGNGHTIRRIELATNTVTTIVGQYSTSGTLDGVGVNARLNYPAYLVGDHQDHLYIEDYVVPIIRRLTISTGVVETIAGDPNTAAIVDGVGRAARFKNPLGMALEGGVLYICDVTAIRAINLSDFSVTTVAGDAVASGTADGVGGAARFFNLSACASDGKGHLLGADTGVVRRFDVGTRAVTTVLGNGLLLKAVVGPLARAGVNFIQGIAFTPSGDAILSDNLESALFLLRFPQ